MVKHRQTTESLQPSFDFPVALMVDLGESHDNPNGYPSVELAKRAKALLEVVDLYTRHRQSGGFLKTTDVKHPKYVNVAQQRRLDAAARAFRVADGLDEMIGFGEANDWPYGDKELLEAESRAARSNLVRTVMGSSATAHAARGHHRAIWEQQVKKK